MAVINIEIHVLNLSLLLFLLVLNVNRILELTANSIVGFNEDERFLQLITLGELGGSESMAVTLHHFRLYNALSILDGDLGFGMKPRSTTWFSRFLIQQYDDARWVRMFQFTIFTLSDLLKSHC